MSKKILGHRRSSKKMVATIESGNSRWRRSYEQIEEDMVEISRMYLEHMTQAQIADAMTELRGRDYTPRQIQWDLDRIRERWTTAVFDNYNTYINQELNRIDVLERELWKALRESADGKVRKVVTQWINDDGEISDSNAKKVVDMIEKSGVSPTFFAQIIEVQKERRRLLGLYADKAVTVTHEVKVKGYKTVTPGDWPDHQSDKVIDGQVIG